MASITALHAATLNVRGLRNRRRQYQLLRLLKRMGVDIAAIQETKLCSDEDTAAALQPFLEHYNVCVSPSAGLSGGCFLLISKKVEFSCLSCSVDDSGRFICCDLVMVGVEWRIICLYAPVNCRERNSFFISLGNFLRTQRKILLMGDFNCVCSEQDRSKPRSRFDQSAATLCDLVHDNGLVDVGQEKGSAMHFTHFQCTSNARLDRIYISSEEMPSISDYIVRPIFFTDHCMVSVCIGRSRPRSVLPQWDLWKLNTSLLADELFCKRISDCLIGTLETHTLSLYQKWDLFKQEARNCAIEESARLSFLKRFLCTGTYSHVGWAS